MSASLKSKSFWALCISAFLIGALVAALQHAPHFQSAAVCSLLAFHAALLYAYGSYRPRIEVLEKTCIDLELLVRAALREKEESIDEKLDRLELKARRVADDVRARIEKQENAQRGEDS